MDIVRREIIPPPLPPARLCDRAFPPYRHVPGLHPHPTAHPDGHSYEGEHAETHGVAPPTLEDWRNNEEYLYGIDLYNYGYWWEAHEAWEALWQLTDKADMIGQYLQGLIQVSAAHLQQHVGRVDGVARLIIRSRAHLENALAQLEPETVIMGVALAGFLHGTQRYFQRRTGHFPFLIPA